jgi:hypothetical protein
MTSTTPHAQGSVESSAQDTSKASESDIPVQRHAGKVGYGPNYHAGPVSPSIYPINFDLFPFSPFIQQPYILIGIYLEARRQGDWTEGGADGEDHA